MLVGSSAAARAMALAQQRLQPLRYLQHCSDCYRVERKLPSGLFPPPGDTAHVLGKDIAFHDSINPEKGSTNCAGRGGREGFHHLARPIHLDGDPRINPQRHGHSIPATNIRARCSTEVAGGSKQRFFRSPAVMSIQHSAATSETRASVQRAGDGTAASSATYQICRKMPME